MKDFRDLDTPALIIDKDKLMNNINFIQSYANKYNVALRPHIKTHKMPYLAKLQLDAGARGITVAKVGEAEVMAEAGIDDIFIADEIAGNIKLERIKKFAENIDISFGVDSIDHVKCAERIFGYRKKAQILIEIEVGDNRSGIIDEKDFIQLVEYIKSCNNVNLRGIFSHEGHTYGVANIRELKETFIKSQERTLKFAKLAKELGIKLETISIGATPPTMQNLPIIRRDYRNKTRHLYINGCGSGKCHRKL